MRIGESAIWTPEWKIFRFNPMGEFASEEVAANFFKGIEGFDPYDISILPGNLLVNTGIGEMWDLICGLGTPTAFNNANARLGVGDSTTAAAATDTGLLAATNKTYKAMDATYPSRNAQTVTFQSTFGSADANYSWNEFIADNGATALKAMNRKVSAQGTKVSGQTWTLQLGVTLS